MGRRRWMKILRFVLMLIVIALIMIYIAPIKAC